VEIFNMMDLAINNLTQQNKELKRTVNELGSKVNKVSINFYETVYDNTSIIIIIIWWWSLHFKWRTGENPI
jgi:hypothetical protein